MIRVVKFFKKYWFFILLAALAFLLSTFWFRAQTTKEFSRQKDGGVGSTQKTLSLLKISYPVFPGQSLPTNTSFNLNVAPTALDANAYSVSTHSVSAGGASLIASNLGFPNEAQNVSTDSVLGVEYSWIKTPSSLGVRLSPLTVSVTTSRYLYTPPGEGALPSPEGASSFVASILEQNKLVSTGVSYLPSYFKENLDGKLLQVGLSPFVEGKKVVDYSPTTALVDAQIQKDGSLYSFSFRAGFEGFGQSGKYPLKNRQEIIDAIYKEGRIMLMGEDSEAPRLVEPKGINIEKIEDVLLFPPEKPDSLLPVFILSGSANTGLGVLPIVVYIPAVRSEYIN